MSPRPGEAPHQFPHLLSLILLLVTCIAGMLPAQTPATSRLAALARLWGYVKYHHPALGYRTDLDWDSALVAAIPKVRRARSTEEFRIAIDGLLTTLDDPPTHVVQNSHPVGDTQDGSDQRLAYRLTGDSVLIVTVGNYYSLSDAESRTVMQRIIASLPQARVVVLDVRSARPVDDYGRFQLVAGLGQLERLVSSSALDTPGERRRIFYGYDNASPFSSGQYRTGFFTRSGQRIRPAEGARNVPSVVILNRYAGTPSATLTLQAVGRGLVVFEGNWATAATGHTATVDLGEGLTAQVRESEPIHPDGTSARLQPDVVVPQGALDTALALARRFRSSAIARRPLPATSLPPTERSYPAMEYPSLEYRLLAAFRFWNTIQYFYPYKHLLHQRWDSVLPEFIPRFEQAANAADYSRTVAEMATRLHDGHAYVAGKVYNEQLIGTGYPPIRVRMIEGVPLVTSLVDSAAGARIGDVVLSVDGEDAVTRLTRYARLISASTEASLLDKAALCFMNGPPGTSVRLRLRDRAGGVREASLPRRFEDYTTLYHRERSGPIIKLLPGNIGYVDLDRLPFDAVDSMFDQLRRSRAIIFDMRGYPNGTFWTIAPRLSSRQQRVALLETPIVGRDVAGAASEAFVQTINPTPPGAWIYQGKTLMLIDERSQSQAEHMGLYLKAANGTVLVGSHTAGANGEITSVTLPGAVTVGFTGQSVRHPDGGELQRTGLVPDVPAKPTIRGVQQGRDEVLERAIQYLNRK